MAPSSPARKRRSAGRFYEVLIAEGGQLFDDKWEPTFNSAAGVKAATMFADLYKAKAMPPDMTNFVWDDVAKNWVERHHRPLHRVVRLVQLLPGSEEQQGRRQVRPGPPAQGRRRHPQRLGRSSRLLDHQGQQEQGWRPTLIKQLTSLEGNQLESKLGILVSRQSVWDKIIKDAATSTDPLDKKRLELALLQAKEDFKTPPLIAEWLPMSNVLYPQSCRRSSWATWSRKPAWTMPRSR